MSAKPPFRAISYLPHDIEVERRTDGSVLLRSPVALGPYDRHMIEPLRRHAADRAGQTWLAQRGPDRAWRHLSYGEALAKVERIAAALLKRGLGQGDAVMILSGNSLEHALLTYGAISAGVPVAPVSQAYSLMSMDHAKLRYVFDLIRPRLIFVQQGSFFETALGKLPRDGVEVVYAVDPPSFAATPFDALLAVEPGPEVAAAQAALGPDTVAKYLFTSGSTGHPKAVINSHRMLCSNVRMAAMLMTDRAAVEAAQGPEVAVDWLPWNHTFGGNANLHGLLHIGGTLYIDEGRPLPGLFDQTIENLREISPTTYLNVPVAYAMLLGAMETDDDLARTFFKRLRWCAYGGAALSQDLWERFQALAIRTVGERINFTTGYGATETAPIVSSVYWETERVGLIGLPLPGVELKLVPTATTMEVRVRGPIVTPGYLRAPADTAAAFDAEGFYGLGDAAGFVDPGDPGQGLVFDGRVSEDFKLDTGTWVQAGKLRVQALSACSPALQDALVTGLDRPYIGLLAWPNWVGLQRIITDDAAKASLATMLTCAQLVEHVRQGLRRHNEACPGSSTRVKRCLIMAEPPSLDGSEITDKGYINQKAALARRAALVEKLYAEPPGNDVIVV